MQKFTLLKFPLNIFLAISLSFPLRLLIRLKLNPCRCKKKGGKARTCQEESEKLTSIRVINSLERNVSLVFLFTQSFL